MYFFVIYSTLLLWCGGIENGMRGLAITMAARSAADGACTCANRFFHESMYVQLFERTVSFDHLCVYV